jgi:5-methylcytosine-specific restriction endonuclease McrA
MASQGSASPIYRSQEWQITRARALRAANYICCFCGTGLRGRGRSRVDHVVPIAKGGAPYDLGNLRCLCPSCDNKRHSEKGRGGAEKPQIDAQGFPEGWR